MSPGEQAAAARRFAGLFRLEDRGLLRIEGADRVRWLDGMLSNDVASLEPGPARSGSHALLLTRQGRIVADPHVLLRDESIWLELSRAAVAHTRETLERFVIADDVALHDASQEIERIALEGPGAAGLVLPELAADACTEVELAGTRVVVAAFALAGSGGRQILAPTGSADAVAAALLRAGSAQGLMEGGAEALEILRIEAGLPRLGAELDEEVLPAEARLEAVVSTTKGCYTGQEVVARMASRGRVAHLLVGLAFAEGPPPQPGERVREADREVGEVTSSCVSPVAGPIALGFVRSAHAEPGTKLRVGDREARVAALPFVPGVG